MAGGTISTFLAVIASITVIAIQTLSTNAVRQSLTLHYVILCWTQWLLIAYGDYILNTVITFMHWWQKVE